MTYNADKCVSPKDLVPKDDRPIAICVGAIAVGSIEPEYAEEHLAISNYPLSAALTCTKLCSAFEEIWDIESQVPE